MKFYHRSSDDCPVQAFLDALPGKVAQKDTWAEDPAARDGTGTALSQRAFRKERIT